MAEREERSRRLASIREEREYRDHLSQLFARLAVEGIDGEEFAQLDRHAASELWAPFLQGLQAASADSLRVPPERLSEVVGRVKRAVPADCEYVLFDTSGGLGTPVALRVKLSRRQVVALVGLVTREWDLLLAPREMTWGLAVELNATDHGSEYEFAHWRGKPEASRAQ